MPQFPEKESSLLAKLKKSKPQAEEVEQVTEKKQRPTAVMSQNRSANDSVSAAFKERS